MNGWSRNLKKMAAYKIFFKKSVWKDFESIPNKDLKRILKRIELLHENPRLPGCKKKAAKEKYRLRQGRYRILYSIQDDELTVVAMPRNKCMMHIFLGIFYIDLLHQTFPSSSIHKIWKFYYFSHDRLKYILNRQLVRTSGSKDWFEILLILKEKFFLARVLLKNLYL